MDAWYYFRTSIMDISFFQFTFIALALYQLLNLICPVAVFLCVLLNNVPSFLISRETVNANFSLPLVASKLKSFLQGFKLAI